MLLEFESAVHFLNAYKEMLNRVAGRKLNNSQEFLEARKVWLQGERTKKPPTDDRDLLLALEESVFGRFVLARHLARHTELIDLQGRVYRVIGVTTELRTMAPPWTVIETVVMKFREVWICDGLITRCDIQVEPNMKRDYLTLLKRPAAKSSKSSKNPLKFTSKQGQYLAFIHQYTKINGQPPSEADMVKYFHVSAPSVHQMILTLNNNGLINRVPGKSRSIELAIPVKDLPALT